MAFFIDIFPERYCPDPLTPPPDVDRTLWNEETMGGDRTPYGTEVKYKCKVRRTSWRKNAMKIKY